MPLIRTVVHEQAGLVHPEPTNWRQVMLGGKVAPWDNAINRMFAPKGGKAPAKRLPP